MEAQMIEMTAQCAASDDIALRSASNWYREDMTEALIDADTVLLRDTKNDMVSYWWLIKDGVSVAMMKTMHRSRARGTENGFTLCDIEVRDGHRGNGYARTLIALGEQVTGETLYTTGNYTPEGFAALSAHLPLISYENTEPQIAYRSMLFVEDWDNLYLIHGR